jgi:hypothetical protein
MLADTSLPHGSDVDLFDRRYVVGALSTGRCLPAVAPRVLVMGDEVRTRSLSPDNHFTPLFKSQPLARPKKAVGLESPIGSWLAILANALLAQLPEPKASKPPARHETVEWELSTGLVSLEYAASQRQPKPNPLQN